MAYNYASAFRKRICPHCAARIALAAAARFALENPEHAGKHMQARFSLEAMSVTLVGSGFVVTYEFRDLGFDSTC